MKRIILKFLSFLPSQKQNEVKFFLLDLFFWIRNKSNKNKYYLSDLYCNLLRNKNGLEIAGPSYMFKTTLPIYSVIKNLDCVNVSEETFNTPIQINSVYKYWLFKKGFFHKGNGADLHFIKNSTYDFVCSRAVLNYIGNPLKALTEWHRIIKPGGYILLTVPHYRYCYMHLMELTKFDHLISDFINNTQDADLEHFEQNINYSSYKKSSPFSNREYLRKHMLKNIGKGGITHHTFDKDLINQIFFWLDMDVVDLNIHLNDIVLLARKRLSPEMAEDIELLI